jgi:hypothetical protein
LGPSLLYCAHQTPPLWLNGLPGQDFQELKAFLSCKQSFPTPVTDTPAKEILAETHTLAPASTSMVLSRLLQTPLKTLRIQGIPVRTAPIGWSIWLSPTTLPSFLRTTWHQRRYSQL